MKIMLEESTKPIVFVGLDSSSTVDCIDMAAAVVGGTDALGSHPCVINYVNATSSLHQDQEAVERLLHAADQNIPTIYAPGVIRGLTAPMTEAGAIALSNAGELAGVVLSQLRREGSSLIRSAPGGVTLDMRYMIVSYAAPSPGPPGWDLGRHYGIPLFGAGGYSDAKVFDGQAAAEAAMSLFASTAVGADLIHDIGYLDCALTGSFELVAFCDEVIDWIKHYLSPDFRVDEETLALDVTHTVGHQGRFLESDHTYRHTREDWIPSLADRQPYERWAEEGCTTLRERANRRVRAILDSHCCERLPSSVCDALSGIRDRADAAQDRR
jgi:trimethylamine--corrinoid protein Co-methyltransferase